jgi:hypothetical protein
LTAIEIIDAVLSPPEPSQDVMVATGSAVAGLDDQPIPDVVPVASPAVMDDAEVIRTLSQLGPGATRKEIVLATLRLTRLFQDSKSMRYYAGVIRDVQRGELPARIPIAAIERARGPGVIRPAAVFTSHIQRCRAVWESRTKRPSG